MRGHLEQRGRNRWRFKVFLGIEDGKRRYATRSFAGTKREAETALAAFVSQVAQGRFDPTTATVGDLMDEWLSASEPNLAPNTLREYRRLVTVVIKPRIGTTRLRDLRPARLDAFYAELAAHGGHERRPLSPRSVRQVHAIIRRALGQAMKWEWISTNAAASATPPRIMPRDPQPPDPGESAKLIAYAARHRPDLAVLLRLASVTGARRGELCGLQWRDLDAVEGTLSIRRAIAGQRNDALVVKSTKTGVSRKIALDSGTVDVLLRHKEVCAARAEAAGVTLTASCFIISPSPAGDRPWRPDGVSLAVGRMKRKVGVTTDLLGLRHAAATQLIAAGVPVRTVAGRLGHSDPATTLRVYAAWLPESDRDAAEVIARISAPASGATEPDRQSG